MAKRAADANVNGYKEMIERHQKTQEPLDLKMARMHLHALEILVSIMEKK